ncbi:MAG TPA: GNAT family N-acetyltransferase [Candidatus Binatia bacterium]|nr:GNAT family N-acetyltransferase [Candidatus Binatia bacterium]
MITQATFQHVPAIRSLMQSVPGFWDKSWRPDVIKRGIAAANGLALVYEDNSNVLGFVCAHDLGFRAYLSELVVAGGARSRGIGTQLVQCVETELVTRGCAVLIADVWRDAERFYRALGWEPPPVVLLRKKLSQDAEN